MSLDILVEVLDKSTERLLSAIAITSSTTFEREEAEFVCGVIYNKMITETDPLQTRAQFQPKTIIELIKAY